MDPPENPLNMNAIDNEVGFLYSSVLAGTIVAASWSPKSTQQAYTRNKGEDDCVLGLND